MITLTPLKVLLISKTRAKPYSRTILGLHGDIEVPGLLQGLGCVGGGRLEGCGHLGLPCRYPHHILHNTVERLQQVGVVGWFVSFNQTLFSTLISQS